MGLFSFFKKKKKEEPKKVPAPVVNTKPLTSKPLVQNKAKDVRPIHKPVTRAAVLRHPHYQPVVQERYHPQPAIQPQPDVDVITPIVLGEIVDALYRTETPSQPVYESGGGGDFGGGGASSSWSDDSSSSSSTDCSSSSSSDTSSYDSSSSWSSD